MGSILIVEDDKDMQSVYQMMIEIIGLDIVGIANDGEEAVKLYKALEHKPDVVLMDHRMPKKNGIETTKEILSISNHSKIIFASGDTSIKDEALSVGAVSFKQKPFSFGLLKNNIEKALGN